MTISTGFLIYVILYRLTVLAVGALAVYLGFRLFTHDPVGHSGTGNTASASAEGGGFKVTMTNFWPGTYFAMFGTVIIGIMLWQGSPQLLMKEIKDATNSGKRTIMALEIRGSESDIDIDRQWEKLSTPGLTLPDAALPLSNIARVWQQEKRIGEAVAMARLASVYSTQDKASHLALLRKDKG